MTSVESPMPEPRPRRQRSAFAFSRPIDRAVLLTCVALLCMIALTLLLGDRVGVTLERVSPLGVARATAPIKIQFSEAMERETLQGRITLDPAVEGTQYWSGNTLIFQPNAALMPGTDYTVTLAAGGRSRSGREVLAEYQFSFSVRQPEVAYLAPADGVPINIWIATPGVEGSERQLTFSPGGIYDFAVSPDGQYIAFSETNPSASTEDIKVIDLETGSLRQVTNCADASCTNPVWRPDGQVLAYERVDFNTGIEGVGISPTRVWLIDLTQEPATTTPLFSDTQILGYNPQWSADGSRIAIFDRGSASILIYDFRDDSGLSIPTRAGTSGALAPDGLSLIFPEVVLREGQEARTFLQVADLTANAVSPLPGTSDFASDEEARWSPDGSQVMVRRRYLDERYTRGHQLALIDMATGQVRDLAQDDRFSNGFFSWDATGSQLVVQRLSLVNDEGQPDNLARPQIWTLDLASGEFTFVVNNAFYPRWVP
jgi:Tol biopolymer transport system component